MSHCHLQLHYELKEAVTLSRIFFPNMDFYGFFPVYHLERSNQAARGEAE
jgi:hypothetical protein